MDELLVVWSLGKAGQVGSSVVSFNNPTPLWTVAMMHDLLTDTTWRSSQPSSDRSSIRLWRSAPQKEERERNCHLYFCGIWSVQPSIIRKKFMHTALWLYYIGANIYYKYTYILSYTNNKIWEMKRLWETQQGELWGNHFSPSFERIERSRKATCFVVDDFTMHAEHCSLGSGNDWTLFLYQALCSDLTVFLHTFQLGIH